MRKNKIKKSVLLLCLLMVCSVVFCQESVAEYVIITYSVDRNKDSHPPNDYYWIVPVDSLSGDNSIKKYPLYFDAFSKNDLKDCQENKDLLLFTLVSNEDFNIDSKVKADISNLKSIVKNNHKKVQQIVKKWSNGYKEKITVYITPIKGEFCYSNLSFNDEKMINYKGVVYLPVGYFSFNETFFKTAKYKEVMYADYIDSRYINTL